MANNLIVDDTSMEEIGRFLLEQGSELDMIATSYFSALKTIRSEGILSGSAAEMLSSYITVAEHLKGVGSTIGKSLQDFCENYIGSIDVKDRYLY